jgi:hypothetical protein
MGADGVTDDRLGPENIARLAEALGMGIMVQSVEAGPPAVITATFLLDARMLEASATGASEEDAWEDLARKATAWKNDDERNVRTYFGGV